MKDDVKERVEIVLNLLKTVLIENHLSMGVSTKDGGKIAFFDTDTYIETGKMDGFSIGVQDMVE